MMGQVTSPLQWCNLKASVQLVSERVVAIETIQTGTGSLTRVGDLVLQGFRNAKGLRNGSAEMLLLRSIGAARGGARGQGLTVTLISHIV